jgi:hypothetical protein
MALLEALTLADGSRSDHAGRSGNGRAYLWACCGRRPEGRLPPLRVQRTMKRQATGKTVVVCVSTA